MRLNGIRVSPIPFNYVLPRRIVAPANGLFKTTRIGSSKLPTAIISSDGLPNTPKPAILDQYD